MKKVTEKLKRKDSFGGDIFKGDIVIVDYYWGDGVETRTLTADGYNWNEFWNEHESKVTNVLNVSNYGRLMGKEIQ